MPEQENTPTLSTAKPGANSGMLGLLWEEAGMLIVLVILACICALTVDGFTTWFNVRSLALAVSTTGMVACTMLFCLASGNFDLSVGSIVACAGVLCAVVINKTGNVPLGVAAGLGMGGVVGLINGVVIAKLKINALITTLATMQIVRGLGYIISNGKAVGIKEESFFILGNSSFLGIFTPIWITIGCFVLFGSLLENTTFGRNTLAVGGNEEAAHLAGIKVDRIKALIFIAQGVIAALAGIVLASRMTSGQPMASQGFELEVISACVLGGVSLTGGVGSILCVISGVLIMGIVQNSMNLLNIPPFYQYVARGLILLGAVIFDRIKQAHRGR